MQVTKRSGEREEFDEAKVKRAVLRVGASESVADEILSSVRGELYDGIPTGEIYRRVRELLDKRRALRFGLKEAILGLGPDGYNFESFVGKVFQGRGYSVRLREIVPGRCVSHEIDVVLERQSERYMVECKFHNSQGIKCSVQEALYTYARNLDVAEALQGAAPWLVTNTKFTSEAIKYAECVGMRLLGWRFPFQGGLEDMIDSDRLYPVTALGLRTAHERMLLQHNVVLASDLLKNKECLYQLLPEADADDVIRRAKDILG